MDKWHTCLVQPAVFITSCMYTLPDSCKTSMQSSLHHSCIPASQPEKKRQKIMPDLVAPLNFDIWMCVFFVLFCYIQVLKKSVHLRNYSLRIDNF